MRCVWTQFSEGVLVVKTLDGEIVEGKFELKSCECDNFRKNTLGKSMNLLILPAIGK